MDGFYGAMAGACFTLLGFWWVVLTFGSAQMMRDPVRRRTARRVSLFFLLPALMCIIALLPVEDPRYWRATFIIAAVVGLVETSSGLRTGAHRPVMVGAFVLFLAIAAVAASPAALRALFPNVSPQPVEGVLLSLLVGLGAQLVWSHFTEVTDGRVDDLTDSPGSIAPQPPTAS